MSDPNVQGKEPVKEPVKTVVTTEYLDSLYKENPQVLEQWISDGSIVKKVLAPWKDSHVSQGINTFKEKTMPEFIEAEVQKVKDEYSKKLNPEDKWKVEMEAKLNEEKNARKRAEIKSSISEYITKLGFSLEGIMIDDFMAPTEEESIEKVNRFYERDKKVKTTLEENFRKAFIQQNNYTPPAGETEAVPFGGDQKAWAAAIKAGKSPASGPEFEVIREKIFRFSNGRK